LAASAEQMSKMSRTMLESMDRFILETAGNGDRHAHDRREPRDNRSQATQYATVGAHYN
jgi:hypothetical protein